jgi:hypothetical protein
MENERSGMPVLLTRQQREELRNKMVAADSAGMLHELVHPFNQGRLANEHMS